MTRTNDTAICATTSAPRTAKRRSPAMASCAFRASPGATLFTPIMGATPALIAHRHARVAVNTSTRQSSARSSETVLFPQLLNEERAAPLGEHQPERRTGHRQKEAFNEEQPGEPPA